MGVYHIERRGVTSRCNKPKSKENLIPMDAPMTEDEEGGMYACWNGEPRRVCTKCLLGLWVKRREEDGTVLLALGALTG